MEIIHTYIVSINLCVHKCMLGLGPIEIQLDIAVGIWKKGPGTQNLENGPRFEKNPKMNIIETMREDGHQRKRVKELL